MPNKEQVEKDITAYCKANNISDIEAFKTSCLIKGLAVFKYGMSPVDNVRRQNGTVQDDEIKEPVVVKRKKVTIKKKESGKAE
jgi:hypothetical protein